MQNKITHTSQNWQCTCWPRVPLERCGLSRFFCLISIFCLWLVWGWTVKGAPSSFIPQGLQISHGWGLCGPLRSAIGSSSHGSPCEWQREPEIQATNYKGCVPNRSCLMWWTPGWKRQERNYYIITHAAFCSFSFQIERGKTLIGFIIFCFHIHH